MTPKLLALPFFGPRLHVDGSGQTSLWAMADPGRGPALGVCVQVRWEQGRCVLARHHTLPALPVVSERWCELPLPTIDPADGDFLACLLVYDWPAQDGDGFAEVDGALVALTTEGITRALARASARHGLVPVQRLASASAFTRGGSQLAFAVGSCQYPATPLNEEVAHASLARLSARLADTRHVPLDFLLLLGDQIYADATAGLMDASALHDRYARKYQAYFAIAALQDILARCPSYMMLDDHEISVDCEPPYHGVRASHLEEGLAAYWAYQRMAAPLPHLWFEAFSNASAGLFVLDTRTAREPRTVRTYRSASMLGGEQMQALRDWLVSREPSSLKLIGSASMLLPRHRDNSDCTIRLDGWDGYPASLHEVLAFICDHDIQNVVFLCGDEHLSCVARIEVRSAERAVQLLSVESSGFYAPFEFANGREENLVLQDAWAFSHGGKDYRCTVQADLPRMGDGYFEVVCKQDTPGWTIWCRFDGARGSWSECYPLMEQAGRTQSSVAVTG